MTGSMVYLIVGFLLGPACAGLLTSDVERDVRLLRTLTEAGLVMSLFAIGMYPARRLGLRGVSAFFYLLFSLEEAGTTALAHCFRSPLWPSYRQYFCMAPARPPP